MPYAVRPMPAISVIIVCANSADTLEPACRSVAWADELIVVDSGSKDRTAEVAQRFAHRYVLEAWRGYSGQKLFAAGLATHDWIFFLDGDEECSPELAAEWQRLTQAELDRLDLLLVPRKNYVLGRYVRSWWPDRLTRIFHRGRCTWGGEALHDTRKPSDPSRVRSLRGCIEHKRHSRAGFSDYFSGKRYDERLLLVAREMHARGKRCHAWDLVVRPWATFLKLYVLKHGWTQGTYGLLMAQKSATGVQLKYAALWAVQNGVNADSPAPKDA